MTKAICNITAQLEALRRHHYSCDDCWYSCPKSEDGCCNHMEGDKCNCGADEHNQKLNQLIAELGNK